MHLDSFLTIGDLKVVGNIWKRAIQLQTSKLPSVTFNNTRRVHQNGDEYPEEFTATKVMPHLKAFGGTVQEIAPKLWGRYKPVEYLESSGTQYIDTGLKTATATKIEMDYQTLKGTGQGTFQTLFGCSESVSQTRGGWYAYISGSSKLALCYKHNVGATPNPLSEDVIEYNTRYVFVFDKDKGYLDGRHIGTCVSGTSDSALNIWLLARNSSDKAPSVGKLYGTKFWNNDILVRNFVPVHDTVGNVYGMFDTVEEKFYGNAGTGSFTAGPEIKRVEYIENTTNSCINTGIYLSDDNHKAEARYYVGDAGSNSTIFGAQNNQNIMALFNGGGYACGNSTVGTTGRITSNVYTDGTHTISFKMAGNEATYILDSDTPKVTSISTSTFNDSYLANNCPVYLFANNNRGAIAQKHVGKIYYFKFWKAGTLIRDFIPVLLGTEYCMLDTVEWKVYRNVGTGAFAGATEIPDRLLNPYTLKSNLGNIRYGYDDGAVIPREYERVEYVESSGTQYIDTGYKATLNSEFTIDADILSYDTLLYGYNKLNAVRVTIYRGTASASGNQRFGTQFFTATTSQMSGRHLYAHNKNSLTIDGISVGTYSTQSDFTIDGNIYLFCGNKGDNTPDYIGRSKIYKFQATNNGVLVRDMIPVKKVSNNEYGMWDTVSKTFFGNVGTGSFTGGNAISRKIVCDGEHKLYLDNVEVAGITDLLPSATSYYDIQTGRLYKDWGIKVLDGSESWDYDSNYGRSRLYVGDWLKPTAVRVQLFYSNYGTCRHNNESINQMITGDMYTATELNTTAFYFTYKNSTSEAFKAWLKEKYDEGNPVIIVYPLATPVTTDISTSQIALLQKGEHLTRSEAEIAVDVQVEFLGVGA